MRAACQRSLGSFETRLQAAEFCKCADCDLVRQKFEKRLHLDAMVIIHRQYFREQMRLRGGLSVLGVIIQWVRARPASGPLSRIRLQKRGR
jgi:hypothetical protein